MATPPVAVPGLLADVNDLPGVLSWIKEAAQTINTLTSANPTQGTSNKVFVMDNNGSPQPMPMGNRDGDLLVVMPQLPTGTPTISVWRSSIAQAVAKTGKTLGGGQWVRIN